jgi:hypothetical protein
MRSVPSGSDRVDLLSGFAPKVLLIHTGLQPGGKAFTLLRNRFNGFIANPGKTVETVFCQCLMFSTGLKPGVNETTFEASKPLLSSQPTPAS